MYVVSESTGFDRIANSSVNEAFLPNWASDTKRSAGFERKAAFDELHGAFKRHALGHRNHEMYVIGHHNKGVHVELPLVPIAKHDLAEQFRHPVGLEHMHLVVRSCRNKIG